MASEGEIPDEVTLKQIQPEKITLLRSLGLFDATMIGVGAMIGAGIFVLTGIAAGEAGPASLLAFALNGIVTLLTATSYAELSSKIPEAGGGYSFIKRAFPGLVGFLSGWMLWFAYTVACGLYALGFAGYFWEFIYKYFESFYLTVNQLFGARLPVLFATGMVLLFFLYLNVRGTTVTGKAENIITISKLLVLSIFIFFGLLKVFSSPSQTAQSFTPFFPKGAGGVFVAMGLTFIAFEGYDLIATVAEEIKNPQRNIPRATYLSVGITVTFYLFIVFVSIGAVTASSMSSWQFLGRFKEVAIVKAAENFMPGIGVLVIVVGGVLSTMSALNATVLASSRVAFTLGRDGWLPEMVSRIHRIKRTPYVAVILTGLIVYVMAFSFPIQIVGSAASLLFLLVFASVNLSLIVIRRKYPELAEGYRAPLFPIIPVIGFFLNIFLAVYQFKFDPRCWYIAGVWVALGVVLYRGYLMKRHEARVPAEAVRAYKKVALSSSYRVIVPIANPDNIPHLLQLAIPIAKYHGGEVVVTNIIRVPAQLPLSAGLRYADKRVYLFKIAAKCARKEGFKVYPDLRVVHSIEKGILSAIKEYDADLVIMGWKGFSSTRERIFGEITDRVLREVNTNVAIVRFKNYPPFKKILLPTSGGPHADYAAQLIEPIVEAFDSRVTACYILPKHAGSDDEKRAYRWIDRTIRNVELGDVERKIIHNNNIVTGIVKESNNYDLVVVGSAERRLFSYILFGEIPEAVAELASASIMLVRRRKLPKLSFVKKLKSAKNLMKVRRSLIR